MSIRHTQILMHTTYSLVHAGFRVFLRRSSGAVSTTGKTSNRFSFETSLHSPASKAHRP